MPPKKNLIITADDFGCCNYIDRGITRGVDRGVVSCVSTFINFKSRKPGERGGAYEGSLKAITKLMNKHRIPVGIHLTINAGVPMLGDKVPNLIKARSIDGHKCFKDINKFEPDLYINNSEVRRQIKNEVEAQLKEFKKNFGKPNHISCHFGILFHFEKILKEVLKIEGIEKYQVRNPILAFQTPVGDEADSVALMKKYFSGKSKMRIEGVGKAVRWSRSFKDLIAMGVDSSKQKRLRLLQNKGIRFPDYTIDYLYKRAGNFKSMEEPLRHLTSNVAECYQLPNRKPKTAVYEIIAHLGHGKQPDSGPVGVNKHYFPSRAVELKRLIDNKKKLRTGLIKLVDYSILK